MTAAKGCFFVMLAFLFVYLSPRYSFSEELTSVNSGNIYKKRYACVVSSAILVSSYFDRTIDSPELLYDDFNVGASGESSIGNLIPFFKKLGLNVTANNGFAPWQVKNYLKNFDCALVLVTDPQEGFSRHSVVFLPAGKNEIAVADLIKEPKLVTDEFLDAALCGNAIVMVVSREELPSPRVLHLKRYGVLYGAGVFVCVGLFVWGRKKKRVR